jgi:hypothetical protein
VRNGTVRPVEERLAITYPRCGVAAEVRFYGPCDECRSALLANYAIDARVVELVEYEPKVNVTPNAVATKD